MSGWSNALSVYFMKSLPGNVGRTTARIYSIGHSSVRVGRPEGYPSGDVGGSEPGWVVEVVLGKISKKFRVESFPRD